MSSMKICSKCGQLRELSAFYIRADTGKIRKQCRYCLRKITNQRRLKNLDNVRERERTQYRANKYKTMVLDGVFDSTVLVGYKKCIKCNQIKELGQYAVRGSGKHRGECKECQSQYLKDYRKKNKKKVREGRRLYYQKNKDRVLKKSREYGKKYYQKNKRTIIKKNIYRKQQDPIFKLRCNTSTLIHHYFKNKGFSKKSKTAKILGCDFKTLYSYLQQTFFNNYNRLPNDNDNLHIDHIIPLSTANTEEEVLKLNYYTNLQWLLASDNIKKGDNLDWSLNV